MSAETQKLAEYMKYNDNPLSAIDTRTGEPCVMHEVSNGLTKYGNYSRRRLEADCGISDVDMRILDDVLPAMMQKVAPYLTEKMPTHGEYVFRRDGRSYIDERHQIPDSYKMKDIYKMPASEDDKAMYDFIFKEGSKDMQKAMALLIEQSKRAVDGKVYHSLFKEEGIFNTKTIQEDHNVELLKRAVARLFPYHIEQSKIRDQQEEKKQLDYAAFKMKQMGMNGHSEYCMDKGRNEAKEVTSILEKDDYKKLIDLVQQGIDLHSKEAQKIISDIDPVQLQQAAQHSAVSIRNQLQALALRIDEDLPVYRMSNSALQNLLGKEFASEHPFFENNIGMLERCCYLGTEQAQFRLNDISAVLLIEQAKNFTDEIRQADYNRMFNVYVKDMRKNDFPQFTKHRDKIIKNYLSEMLASQPAQGLDASSLNPTLSLEGQEQADIMKKILAGEEIDWDNLPAPSPEALKNLPEASLNSEETNKTIEWAKKNIEQDIEIRHLYRSHAVSKDEISALMQNALKNIACAQDFKVTAFERKAEYLAKSLSEGLTAIIYANDPHRAFYDYYTKNSPAGNSICDISALIGEAAAYCPEIEDNAALMKAAHSATIILENTNPYTKTDFNVSVKAFFANTVLRKAATELMPVVSAELSSKGIIEASQPSVFADAPRHAKDVIEINKE